nr:sugar phosphate exchanger; solute carrier family [Hymenolepis microstoma]
MGRLPVGVRCCQQSNFSLTKWRAFIFISTLYIYATFHASRKPISVVKSALHPNCTEIALRENKTITPENATFCMWKPFDTDDYNAMFGYLDLSFLLSYALGMFFLGHVAEKVDLRLFLTFGCILSGLTTANFGIAYFANLHSLWFFFLSQIICGFFQSSGWPAVVTIMGNWFGKSKRGLILGFWNSHVSLGNILGGVVAGIFVDSAWGWSFFVPGAIVAFSGVLSYFFLVPFPEDLGFPPTDVPPKDDDHEYDSSNEGEQDQAQVQTSDAALEQESIIGEGQADDMEPLTGTVVPQIQSRENVRPITFVGALAVPGVVEYSLCLFFLKATAYIFLFWLPKYLKDFNSFDATLAADISAIFDVGGILGGIFAGFITDRYSCSATVCVCMIIPGMPLLYVYYLVGAYSNAICTIMLIILGFLIVGPYCLITTAVSADLGTHESLQGNARALATVVSIIDGTGSLGAAVGPCLVGLLIDHGWVYVFAMLIVFLGVASLCLISRSVKELRPFCRRSSRHYILLA